MGLHCHSVNWFKSYLSDRQQLVDVSGTFSTRASITCGVPQGSILGPLLFLIYVNDMSAVVENKLLLYADDSGILVTGKSISDIELILSKELEKISNWLTDNKLSLHIGKTESILFGSKPRLRPQSTLNISCNGQSIKPTNSVKYLGASLDQSLSGESMARSVIKKANSRLKFLYRKGQFLTLHTKKLLVMSLIQCHFDYACSFWYPGLTQTLKNRLQTTQNKLIRFVLNLDGKSHISHEHFKLLNWLPVSKRVDQIILCHVFKIKQGTAPDYLGEHFVPLNSVHNRCTRSNMTAIPIPDASFSFTFSNNGRYVIPKVGSFGKKSFSYRAVYLWNALPKTIRNIETLGHFKHAIKQHLLDS